MKINLFDFDKILNRNKKGLSLPILAFIKMTITYSAEVATAKFGCFLKLLLRWRGSIYKLLYQEFAVFVLAFYGLNLMYKYLLDETQRRTFEIIARYCEENGNMIPLSFVLGFYVNIVVTRWWDQYNYIPWPDHLAVCVTANVNGHDERGRTMRRTMMRYMCLALTLTFSSISPPVKKRFPTLQHITDAGFMNQGEQVVLENIATPHNKYFVPLIWCSALVSRARKEGRILDDMARQALVEQINAFRLSLGTLFSYDWISVPIVYTQVVTLAVYMYFLAALIGRQILQRPNAEALDIGFPFFTFLQFFFYMGWLKVAESLVNPFGDDDDDFDCNQLLDRNLQVSYLIVDEMHQEHPELIRDQYWDDTEFELPYTLAASMYRSSNPFMGSAADTKIDPILAQVEIIPPGQRRRSSLKKSDAYALRDAIKKMKSEQERDAIRELPGTRHSLATTAASSQDREDVKDNKTGRMSPIQQNIKAEIDPEQRKVKFELFKKKPTVTASAPDNVCVKVDDVSGDSTEFSSAESSPLNSDDFFPCFSPKQVPAKMEKVDMLSDLTPCASLQVPSSAGQFALLDAKQMSEQGLQVNQLPSATSSVQGNAAQQTQPLTAAALESLRVRSGSMMQKVSFQHLSDNTDNAKL